MRFSLVTPMMFTSSSSVFGLSSAYLMKLWKTLSALRSRCFFSVCNCLSIMSVWWSFAWKSLRKLLRSCDWNVIASGEVISTLLGMLSKQKSSSVITSSNWSSSSANVVKSVPCSLGSAMSSLRTVTCLSSLSLLMCPCSSLMMYSLGAPRMSRIARAVICPSMDEG